MQKYSLINADKCSISSKEYALHKYSIRLLYTFIKFVH